MKRLAQKSLIKYLKPQKSTPNQIFSYSFIRKYSSKQLCFNIQKPFCVENKPNPNPFGQTINLLDNDSQLYIENSETRKVNDFVAKGNYNEAITRCKHILSLSEGTDDNRIRYLLAFSLKQVGKNKEAIEGFKNFINQVQQSSEQEKEDLDTFVEVSHYELALLYQQSGNFADCVNYTEKSIQLNPLYANQSLIESYIVSRQIDRGIKFLQIQHERVPNNESILFLLGFLRESKGDVEGALQDYQKVIDMSDEQKHAQGNLRAGMILKRKGDYESSTCFLMRSAEADPQNYTAKFNLGQNFRYLGEGMLGKENLEACLQLQPNNPLPYYDLALCLEQTGEIEKCIEFLQKNVEAYDTHVESYLRLVNIFAAQNDRQQALKYIKTGINSDEFFREDVNCIDLVQALFEKAENSSSGINNITFTERIEKLYGLMEAKFFHMNLDQGNRRYQMFNLFTQLFLLTDQIELAIETEKRLVEFDKNSLQHRVNLATLYRNKKQFSLAIDQYKELIQLKPDEANYHYFCAQIQLQAGMIKDAINSYTLAIRLQGENDYCLFELSHCYKLNNQIEEQERCKQTLLQYFPDFFSEEINHIKFIENFNQ